MDTIHIIKQIVDTKEGAVRLLFIDPIPANKPIFTEFNVKYNARVFITRLSNIILCDWVNVLG